MVRRKVWGTSETKRRPWQVKRLMPETLLNHRFRGTTLPYEELLIELDNIVIDEVATHSVSKVKKIDTSAPMEIGMAEKGSKKGTEKRLNLQCKQCAREHEPKMDGMEEGPQLECTSIVAKVKKERIVLERDSGPKTGGRKGGKGRERRQQSLLELWEDRSHCGNLYRGELVEESECC